MRNTSNTVDYVVDSGAENQKVLDNVGNLSRGWFDLWWPTLIFAAIVTGSVFGSEMTFGVLQSIYAKVAGYTMAAQPQNCNYVLIVSANAERQMQVSATLSPRGLSPLFARNAGEINARVAQYPTALKMAVVDDSLNSGSVRKALRGAVPAGRIVYVPAQSSPQTVAQILLDRVQQP